MAVFGKPADGYGSTNGLVQQTSLRGTRLNMIVRSLLGSLYRFRAGGYSF